MTPADFKRIRTAVLGITQAKLTKLIYRSIDRISKYEKGHSEIPAQTAALMEMLEREKLK